MSKVITIDDDMYDVSDPDSFLNSISSEAQKRLQDISSFEDIDMTTSYSLDQEETEELKEKKLPELKEIAKNMGISTSQMNKKDIIQAIETNDNNRSEGEKGEIMQVNSVIMDKLVEELINTLRKENFAIYNFSEKEMGPILEYIEDKVFKNK